MAKDLGNVAAAAKDLGLGYSPLHSWIRAAEVRTRMKWGITAPEMSARIMLRR